MSNESKLVKLAARFRRGSRLFRSLNLQPRANFIAVEGREQWGIWRLRPRRPQTESAWVSFSLLASLAVEELGIRPMHTPESVQFDPTWPEQCNRMRSDPRETVPAGLDEVDPCTRAWLHFLWRKCSDRGSSAFEAKQNGGLFREVWEASAIQCERSAQERIQERLTGENPKAAAPSAHFTAKNSSLDDSLRSVTSVIEVTEDAISRAMAGVDLQQVQHAFQVQLDAIDQALEGIDPGQLNLAIQSIPDFHDTSGEYWEVKIGPAMGVAPEVASSFVNQPADSLPSTASQISGDAAGTESPGNSRPESAEAAPSAVEHSGVVSEDQIRELLANQGVLPDQVTYANLEQALHEYRRLHSDADFSPELRSILAYSDFAHRNRALFHEKWNEAKLLAVNPKQWQDLAKQFQDLLASEAEGLRSLEYKEGLQIYGDHLNCRWTSNREDEVSLRFDVLAAAAGQNLGASRGIQEAIRETNVGSWADFWKYCLWFHLGDTTSSTIVDPLKASVKLCLLLAFHSETDESRKEAAGGIAEQESAKSTDTARFLIRTYIETARSKVQAVANALKAGGQTLDAAATELELEARIWGQHLHNAILEEAALEGVPPEQFEKRATESAREIVVMAANEFSVRRGADTTNGLTPFLIGRTPAVVQSHQPPEINSWRSIVQYLTQVLANYPQQYRQDNLSVYKLSRGAESVDLAIPPARSGEQEAPSATKQPPDPPPAGTQPRVPLHTVLKEAESRTADPKLRHKLKAVLRYNRYFEDLKVLKRACKRHQTPALLEQQFPDLDVWAALGDDDKADIAKGEFDSGRFAWSLVMRFIKLTGNDDRTLKNYRSALKAAGLL